MRPALLLTALLLLAVPARAAPDDAAATLCRSNPAYSLGVMQSVLQAQLAKDHDPALDETPPDQLAVQAVEQGVGECADDLRRDPTLFQALAGFGEADRKIAWDAYNTACADRHGTKTACVQAEVGSVRALKRLAATDNPPGAKALVQACELVLTPDPPMTEWRQCVDLALAVKAPSDAAAKCKLSVAWHVAKTGAEAGRLVGDCLRGG